MFDDDDDLDVELPRILIVTAVEPERSAIERGLSLNMRAACAVVAGGVGAAAVAATAAEELLRAERDEEPFAAAVSAGIGGAFPGAARIGDLLVAERIIAADLGADGPEGFASVEELGFGTATYAAAVAPLKPLKLKKHEVVYGDLLTVNTATGTAERAAWLRERHPAAIGEAMEGYGVAVAAERFGIPFAEIRAVSNLIGPRDRSAWRIAEALATLTEAAAPIVEGLMQ